MPLGPTLTYTTEKLKNLRNFLESNKCIHDNMCHHKNCNPRHDLPQTFGGRKSVCLVWLQPTENLQSHPRTSFRINERYSDKHDTQKSTINKIRLEKSLEGYFRLITLKLQIKTLDE